MPTLHSPHPLQSPQCSYVPAHIDTTVPPGSHYKVRIPTMQAASNAALAGGSPPRQVRIPPSQGPLQCVTPLSFPGRKTAQYRYNCVVQSHIEPFSLSPDASKPPLHAQSTFDRDPYKPANKPLCEPVPLHKQVTLPSLVNPAQGRTAAPQTI